MNTAELTYPGLHVQQVFRSPLPQIKRFFQRQDLALDLGTANTLIYARGHGIILNEPSVVALNQDNKVICAGHEAARMIGKTSSSIRCIRPLKNGVIQDDATTATMIRHFLKQVLKRRLFSNPRLVIGVPADITQVEKRAVIRAAVSCGIDRVYLIEEATAAAIGADLPIDANTGTMLVDIGGGTTGIAILCHGQTLSSTSLRVGGDDMDEAIKSYLKRHFKLIVGTQEAERIKILLGTLDAQATQARKLEVYGSDLHNRMPRSLLIHEGHMQEALREPLRAIVRHVIYALEQINPEIARDIFSRGIYLTGGGSLLKGISTRMYQDIGIRCSRINDPLCSVVRGAGRVVEEFSTLKSLCIS